MTPPDLICFALQACTIKHAFFCCRASKQEFEEEERAAFAQLQWLVNDAARLKAYLADCLHYTARCIARHEAPAGLLETVNTRVLVGAMLVMESVRSIAYRFSG